MICRSAGSPATARSSQSRQASASSWYPADRSAPRVRSSRAASSSGSPSCGRRRVPQERGGGGGDDAAGRGEGEGLQGDQGSARRRRGADRRNGSAPPRPASPRRWSAVPRTGRRAAGATGARMPGQDEGDLLARLHGELRVRTEVLAPGAYRGLAAQPHRVRARDRHPLAVRPAHPRHDGAVVEAQLQCAVHRHPAAESFDDADEIGACSRCGMKSVTRTAPASVSHSESSTSVSCRYARRVQGPPPWVRSASDRGSRRRGSRRSRRPSRTVADRASRRIRPGPPARRSVRPR